MGVPDDANPLNRRLPAEVVSRRRTVAKPDKAKEEPALVVDRAQVLGMKPDHRFKWLLKALQRCQEGKLQASIIYDILTHAKFTSDCHDKVGARMYRAVLAHINFFSQKQRRHLEGDCALARMAKKVAERAEKETKRDTKEKEDDDDDEETAAAPSSSAADEMMARVQEFAREREKERLKEEQAQETEKGGEEDVAALWSSLARLPTEEQEAKVAKLDPKTKRRLEDFLEARVSKGRSGGDASASPEAQERPPAGSRSRSGSVEKPPARSGSESSDRDTAKKGKSSKEAKGRSSKVKEREKEKAKEKEKDKAKKKKEGKEVKSKKAKDRSRRRRHNDSDESGSDDKSDDRDQKKSEASRSRSRSRGRRR